MPGQKTDGVVTWPDTSLHWYRRCKRFDLGSWPSSP